MTRLHHSSEALRQEGQKGLIEMRKATQQWAVAQADLRSTRHQLKVLQQQVQNRMLSILLWGYPSGFNVGGILYTVRGPPEYCKRPFAHLSDYSFNIVVLCGSTLEYYRSDLLFLKGVAVFGIICLIDQL